jgi:hypothetical protein
MIRDFPITPPIRVKDSPRERRLASLEQARAFVDEALAMRRSAPWRQLQMLFNGATSEQEAIEAVVALRQLLMIEGLLDSSTHSHA